MSYTKEIIDKYIDTFTDIEKMAYEIAKDHLESSFDLVETIGFKEWIKKNKIKTEDNINEQ
tara:strand:- start:42 stop:224 length:183 start_codon:yes stop_codon:yes gene_type:complete